jgi:uncharacterized membrane protein
VILIDKYINLILLFLIYSFFGWIWESIYISINDKKITNRGFLNGPYIPIYGFGGIFVYIFLNKFFTYSLDVNIIYIYVLGLLSATVIEYLTSFILEKTFNAQWWDYSNKKMNINGRICLEASLFWGLLSVIFIELVNPILIKYIYRLSHDLSLIIISSLVTLMVADLLTTIKSIINLQEKISNILSFDNNKFDNIKEKINLISELPEEYKQMFGEYKNKLYLISNPFIKRLIRAYPKLKFKSLDKQNIFIKIKDIKENIKKR